MTKPGRCNTCGNNLRPYLHKVCDPLTGDEFAVSVCTHCGLGHTMPQPETLDKYYAARYYGNRHGFTTAYCMKRRMGFVTSALPKIDAGAKLLDIGCGDGSFLLVARREGWNVMGTELNPLPARSAGLEVKDSVELIEGRNQFDCITMWHTLEHMRDIPSVLRNAHTLLKPEGCLVIAVPDFGGLQARIFGPRWLHVDVPRHLYHFDIRSLKSCLEEAGFIIHNRWHQEFEFDLLGWSQSALNYLMPSHPNLFFDTLTGKIGSAGMLNKGIALLLGSFLTFLSLPALVIGTLVRRGGSLIVVARKS